MKIHIIKNGVATVTSTKIDFKTRRISKDNKGHFILIKSLLPINRSNLASVNTNLQKI